MSRLFKLFTATVFVLVFSSAAQAQNNRVVVVPLFDDAPAAGAVYTAVAPIVLTGMDNTEITFDISQMPTVPLDKIPTGIPSSRLLTTNVSQPSSVVMCTIVTQGIFPSRNGIDEYIGQIVWGGWNFAPRASAQCDGQLLAISSNTALFSLLGTNYGGDGRTTFGLPDMRGRVQVHQGRGLGLTPRSLGQKYGAETIGTAP